MTEHDSGSSAVRGALPPHSAGPNVTPNRGDLRSAVSATSETFADRSCFLKLSLFHIRFSYSFRGGSNVELFKF